MKNVLLISCSARRLTPDNPKHQSITRRLAEVFVAELTTHTKTQVIHRDLALQPPSFIDENYLAAAFAGEHLTDAHHQALAESDELISEVKNADIIVIASPMYNYGMPAVLKAWFDQIIRIGKTFSFDLARGDQPLEPILSGKEVVLLASWGESNFRHGEALRHMNHLSTHIAELTPYLGGSQLHEIASQYQEFDDDRHAQSKEEAFVAVRALAERLADCEAMA